MKKFLLLLLIPLTAAAGTQNMADMLNLPYRVASIVAYAEICGQYTKAYLNDPRLNRLKKRYANSGDFEEQYNKIKSQHRQVYDGLTSESKRWCRSLDATIDEAIETVFKK